MAYTDHDEVIARRLPALRQAMLSDFVPGGFYDRMYDLVSSRRADPRIATTIGSLLDQRSIASAVADARLWFVAPDANDLIAQAAPSIPDESSLDPSTIRPLLGTESVLIGFGGGGIEAVTWVTGEDRGIPLRLLLVCPVNDPVTGNPSIHMSWLAPLPEDVDNELSGKWSVVVASLWAQGSPLTTPAHDHPEPSESDMEDRRILLATLSLISQDRVMESAIERPSRQVRRALERSGKDASLDDVRVCDLRSAARAARQVAGGQEGRYKHRWIVDGHWRSQPYGPERSLRRPVWIAPHLKGPDGAPMLTGEKVKVLR